MNLPKEMATRGLVISCSQARRLIATGHVAVNGEVVDDICSDAGRDDCIEIVRKRDVNRDVTEVIRLDEEPASKAGAV